MHWKDDQILFLNALTEYRQFLEGKELKEARRLTKLFSETLHMNTKQLHLRTAQSN